MKMFESIRPNPLALYPLQACQAVLALAMWASIWKRGQSRWFDKGLNWLVTIATRIMVSIASLQEL